MFKIGKKERQMKKTNDQESRRQHAVVATTGCMLLVLMLNSGCSGPEAPAADTSKNGSSPPTVTISAPEVSEDAPVFGEVYPALEGGILTYARLMELDPGVVLLSEGVQIKEADLLAGFAEAPPEMRSQMKKGLLMLLENHATDALLTQLVQESGVSSDSPEAVQRFIEQKLSGVGVTDDEVRTFFDENQAMIGDAPFDQIAPRIRQHLMQQRQQEAFVRIIRDMGQQRVIALSGDWAKTQAAAALDNPVDRARASGLPTMASFGADSCMPCQMMKPIREQIAEKYAERLNVVYVHVNKDQMLAQRYRVQGIPFMVFFNADGQKVHEQAGMMSEKQIEEWLQKSGLEI